MLKHLSAHPFAVDAKLSYLVSLTFAFPKESLQWLIPDCLELNTFNDETAFIALAFVKVESLKPKAFPNIFGRDFILIGFRVFVQYINKSGKRMNGLYILKTATTSEIIKLGGNIFTHYKYEKIDIKEEREDNKITINSPNSGLLIKLLNDETASEIPTTSPFETWKDARKFSGPMPYTFGYKDNDSEITIVQGVRKNWKPIPLKVLEYKVPFIENLTAETPKLASAFLVENVPYHWKKGVREAL